MKTLQFKRNSWHYKVAKFVDFDDYNTDFCSYVRHVLGGLFVMTILASCIIGFTICLGDLLGLLAAMAVLQQTITPGELATIGIIIIGVVSFLATFFGLMYYKKVRDDKKRDLRYQEGYVEPPPSFIAKAYESIKERTCFKIELN